MPLSWTRGANLDAAFDQTLGYFPGLADLYDPLTMSPWTRPTKPAAAKKPTAKPPARESRVSGI